jgi:hypothetical protein
MATSAQAGGGTRAPSDKRSLRKVVLASFIGTTARC